MFLPSRHLLTTALFGFAIAASSMTNQTNQASAADPSQFLGPSGGQHRILNGDMPPGFVGGARLRGRGPGPVIGYFQPVAFQGPQGTRFALANQSGFFDSEENLQAGLIVGSVYRFKITDIPGREGAEVYPTIEVIDRTYPPPGLATRYPITVQIDDSDLRAAIAGQLVTRVIYLEDPQSAVALEQTPASERPMDIGEYQDALEVADRFGRPVAILRMGSLAPPHSHELMPSFLFGSPAWAPIMQAESVSHTVGSVPVNLHTQP
ncbi:hypothetical protein Pla22_02200 [Rubripirellula amarantea]|uniref:Uncharacterized protein n=1 Tax=Rubripirellula amarantea TaxID=2527999 RepID=A0A5C5WP41_9BACT|nr:hypothetical protein [Rubripirellula amarantea]TWT52596.1 hypothetical protein Pla22_02200 [Rubripirellula amarantea]